MITLVADGENNGGRWAVRRQLGGHIAFPHQGGQCLAPRWAPRTFRTLGVSQSAASFVEFLGELGA